VISHDEVNVGVVPFSDAGQCCGRRHAFFLPLITGSHSEGGRAFTCRVMCDGTHCMDPAVLHQCGPADPTILM